MSFHSASLRPRVARGGVVSSWPAVLALLLTWLAATATAHEIQPSVGDLIVAGDALDLEIEASVEPFIAGADLDGLVNTNASAVAAEVDRLRALPPEDLAGAFRAYWPAFREQLRVTSGGAPVALSLDAVEVAPVGDVSLPRSSVLSITGTLPPGDAPVEIAWAAELGVLVLRQMEAGPDPYTGFLEGGAVSDPIPRSGGVVQGALRAFADYVPVGFDHIVPKGLDHILFVLGLFFLSTRIRPLLWQVTAFTAAHTVSLALASLGIVRVPAGIVEPLIAASIVYVGVENVLSRGMTPWRPVVVLGFGLLHGLGFASVLSEFGLGSSNFAAKLIGFNVGVELGQLAVIAAAFLAVGLWFGRKPWYKRYIADPASIAIALVGAFWVVERTIL